MVNPPNRADPPHHLDLNLLFPEREGLQDQERGTGITFPRRYGVKGRSKFLNPWYRERLACAEQDVWWWTMLSLVLLDRIHYIR